jgi:hypothetical protein
LYSVPCTVHLLRSRRFQGASPWATDIFEQTTRPPFARGTQEEFIKFLGYALGSLDETQSHLCAAYDRKYISKEQFAQFFGEGTEIRQLTVAFIRSMIMTPRRRSHARQATDLVEPSV